MKIIAKVPAQNGAYPPLQDWSGLVPPEGHYQWPQYLSTEDFYAYNGFVKLTTARNLVVSYAPNVEAWEAWKASLPPEPVPEPTPQDDTDSMLVDHEYRITLLELGVTDEF